MCESTAKRRIVIYYSSESFSKDLPYLESKLTLRMSVVTVCAHTALIKKTLLEKSLCFNTQDKGMKFGDGKLLVERTEFS